MNREGKGVKIATFAGGCFWCTEADFEKLPGVLEVVAGYTGGSKEDPTYEEVCSGSTGHLEAIQVHYDPIKISYEQLLDFFWRHIDPTDSGGQFVDRGPQYRSAIFYHDEEQRRLAEESKAALIRSGMLKRSIVTQIIPSSRFYEAEAYHQDFHSKSPQHYRNYRLGSGRDPFLCQVWGSEGKGKASGEEGVYQKPDEGTRINSIPEPDGQALPSPWSRGTSWSGRTAATS
jgi:peptide methionine sulfoxide reductase msrA/msrB